MTLLDLLKLIKRYLKLVIILPVACAIITAAALLIIPSTFEAKATLVTNGDLALATGMAQNEAADFSLNGIKVAATSVSSSKTVTITASGKDYGGCIAAANATILALEDELRASNAQATINISEATSAANTSPSLVKTPLAALLAGLFVAICIVVIIDMVWTPIKSRRDIEEASELPVIGIIPSPDKGERLLANIRFVADRTPATIAVVPVGLVGGTTTCAELASALENSGISVNSVKVEAHDQEISASVVPGAVTLVECAPLSEGMSAAYIAKDSDVTVLCATEWEDSRKALAATTAELKLAQANVAGVVFLLTSKSDEDFC